MAWMRRPAARVAARLWFPWLLCTVIPSIVLLFLLPFGLLPLWTALPGAVLATTCFLARFGPHSWKPVATKAATVLLVPGVLLLRGAPDSIVAAMSGTMIDTVLNPVGPKAPWRGEAIIDLQTGEIHTDSAHQRLLVRAHVDDLQRRLSRLSPGGRWFVTDGHGNVALFKEAGDLLAHRRLRLPEKPGR
jgi:hypothetical protein